MAHIHLLLNISNWHGNTCYSGLDGVFFSEPSNRESVQLSYFLWICNAFKILGPITSSIYSDVLAVMGGFEHPRLLLTSITSHLKWWTLYYFLNALIWCSKLHHCSHLPCTVWPTINGQTEPSALYQSPAEHCGKCIFLPLCSLLREDLGQGEQDSRAGVLFFK